MYYDAELRLVISAVQRIFIGKHSQKDDKGKKKILMVEHLLSMSRVWNEWVKADWHFLVYGFTGVSGSANAAWEEWRKVARRGKKSTT